MAKTPASHAGDPGSNPGQRIPQVLKMKKIICFALISLLLLSNSLGLFLRFQSDSSGADINLEDENSISATEEDDNFSFSIRELDEEEYVLEIRLLVLGFLIFFIAILYRFLG